MPVITINEAWNKGRLAKTSKLILPVQERKITLSCEETGVYGGQKLSTKGINECHCISTGRMENGMLKIIGEAMPILLELEGEEGAIRGATILHYVCSMLFNLPQGISVCHITLHDWKKYRKRLGLIANKWHWLATNHCKSADNSCGLGLFFASDSHEYGSTLYLTNETVYNGRCAIRPVYHVPIHNPNIRIEVPEEGEELRLIRP